MSWFVMAVLARFLWAWCNVADHYVARHFKGKSALSVALFGEWITIPLLLCLIAAFGVPEMPPRAALLWVGLGALFSLGGIFPYLAALRRDEAQNIVPLFELTPVCVMLFAFTLFGEVMTPMQTLFAAGCVIGGFFFLWDFERSELKTGTFILMLVSSAMFAACQLTMRDLAETIPAHDVVILLFTGTVLMSLVLSLFAPSVLKGAFEGLRRANGKILAAAFTAQSLGILANLAIIYAYVNAPLAGQVAALSGVQPIFAFMIAHIVSYTAPGHYNKLVWNKDLKIKMALLALIVLCSAGLKLS